MASILPSSVQSLGIQPKFKEQVLSSATAFTVDSKIGPLLITNRHNVTGRDNTTGKCLSPTGGVPDRLAVWHLADRGSQIAWVEKEEPLFDDAGKPRWKEHPKLGADADFVALLLTDLSGVKLMHHDVASPREIWIAPAEMVSVVGFPFGIGGQGAPAIWATGFIASEPEIDHNGLPQLLIDCRSRQGQSGSAVLIDRRGGYRDLSGNILMGANRTELLGIYSGRINEQSDLGIVWKASAILDLVRAIETAPPKFTSFGRLSDPTLVGGAIKSIG